MKMRGEPSTNTVRTGSPAQSSRARGRGNRGARMADRRARRDCGVAGMAQWVAAAGLVAMSTLTGPVLAQTGSDDAAPVGSTRTEALERELAPVDAYRLALLRMRGYLSVARALIQVGDEDAGHYMGPPLEQTYRSVANTLAERNAPVTEDMLRELERAGNLAPAQALPAIESAVNAINGSFAQTGAMDRDSVLDLVEALLRAAVANYAEAVSDNEVIDPRKYQTGRGFVTQAEALVRHSSALSRGPDQKRLLKIVTLIRQAWPGIMPPPIAFGPDRVAQRLNEAVAVMEEMR